MIKELSSKDKFCNRFWKLFLNSVDFWIRIFEILRSRVRSTVEEQTVNARYSRDILFFNTKVTKFFICLILQNWSLKAQKVPPNFVQQPILLGFSRKIIEALKWKFLPTIFGVQPELFGFKMVRYVSEKSLCSRKIT